MAQYKCKRCGNLIEVEDGAIIAVCDNCLLAQPIVADNMTNAPENKPASSNADVVDEIQPLVRRAFLFLEDGEWEKADEYFERILDKKPECAEAYLGKIMTQFRVSKREDLRNCEKSIKGNNYDKIMRFGDDKIKAEIKSVADAIENRIAPRVKPDKIESLEQEKTKTTEYETSVETIKTTSLEGKKNKQKIFIIIAIAVAVVISFVLLLNLVIIPNGKYNDAVEAEKNSDKATAAILFGQLGDYKDAEEKSFALWDEIAVRETNSAGYLHTVGLKKDGTVVAVGDNDFGQCDVEDWKDIVAISAGDRHTVGLKKDGTVVAAGSNYYGQCDVSDLKDIVAISTETEHTVGLKKDGTVVAVGANYYGECDVSDWEDIVAISAGHSHTVGLKKDGTVVATGANMYGRCDVDDWTDIVAISTGYTHTIGLKSDGTVIATKYIDDPDEASISEYDGQCDVSDWGDIVAISAGYWHTIGLKKDGTVVSVGANWRSQCDVEVWKEIVAISAGSYHTVGLKKDGTVVAVGDNDYGQGDVSSWRDIKLPITQ